DRRAGARDLPAHGREEAEGAAAADRGRCRVMEAQGSEERLGPAPPLELGGGVECTISRVGDDYRDQVVETGHASRLSDIDAMAGLGIKAVRYPILWEWVAPEVPTELNFSWHDERLERLRDRGIKVIAGLLHHGSGPQYTNLLDPEFPDKFARYAAQAALR